MSRARLGSSCSRGPGPKRCSREKGVCVSRCGRAGLAQELVQAASTPELSPWSLVTLKLTQVLCETVALPQSRGCAQVGFPEGLGKGSDEHNPWWNPTRTSNVLCFKICPCICAGGHPRLPSSQYGLGRATYTSVRGGQPSPQTGNFVPAFGATGTSHGIRLFPPS